MSTASLGGLAVYNPGLLSKEELVGLFIARQPLFDALLADLRRKGASQHSLLIGQRGMGKTTLLLRLRYAIEDDPELRAMWLPLTFPEEQYNVARLSDFYLNCLDALGDALERAGRRAEAERLDRARDALPTSGEDARANAARQLLLDTAKRAERRLVLFLDNVELIFDRLKESQWKLRELLSTEKRLLVLGATASSTDDLTTYSQPFYDFFHVHELRGLTEAEALVVLRHLARTQNRPQVEKTLDEDPARFRTVHALTGGSPRILVLLFQSLALEGKGDPRADLEQILDGVTPLYKHRFEAMAPQAQRIVDAVAIHFHPMKSSEIAEATGLSANLVSSLLTRLKRDGTLEEVPLPGRGRSGYQIAERFFNIWYLMRQGRRVRQKLLWLVELMRALFGMEELRKRASARLRQGEKASGDAEYLLALAACFGGEPLAHALKTQAIRGVVELEEARAGVARIRDLVDDDPSLEPIVDVQKALRKIRADFRTGVPREERGAAEELAEALIENSFRSLENKARLAEEFRAGATRRSKATAAIREGLQGPAFETAPWHALRSALRQGVLRDGSDVAAAEAAAQSAGVAEIVPLVWVHRLVTAPSDLVRSGLLAALEKAPRLAVGWWLLLQAYQKVGDTKAAARVLDAASTASAGYEELGYIVCFEYAAASRFDDAEVAIRRMCSQYFSVSLDKQLARFTLMAGLLHQKRWDPAAALLRGGLAECEVGTSNYLAWAVGFLVGADRIGRGEDARRVLDEVASPSLELVSLLYRAATEGDDALAALAPEYRSVAAEVLSVVRPVRGEAPATGTDPDANTSSAARPQHKSPRKKGSRASSPRRGEVKPA